MQPVIAISNVNKTYEDGFQALKNINLEIQAGEIFGLLGPNGAGKTTLISLICGINKLNEGSIVVGGHDILQDYRKARSLIGLVPQELTTNAFESVWDTVCFTRGLFGKPPNAFYIEQLLKDLSLWDKRKNRLMTLSGGMKRRVMIAKALSHEPRVLFLDEPTAGVDVELRKDMWKQVHQLRSSGVTIILTTHYIDEAEEMADRIGVINGGEIVLVEEKPVLMKKLGKKQMIIELKEPLGEVPSLLAGFGVEIEGSKLIYNYDEKKDREHNEVFGLFEALNKSGIAFKDLNTKQSSLEEIFVALVNEK